MLLGVCMLIFLHHDELQIELVLFEICTVHRVHSVRGTVEASLGCLHFAIFWQFCICTNEQIANQISTMCVRHCCGSNLSPLASLGCLHFVIFLHYDTLHIELDLFELCTV